MKLTKKIESHIEELILSELPAEGVRQVGTETRSAICEVVGKPHSREPRNGMAEKAGKIRPSWQAAATPPAEEP